MSNHCQVLHQFFNGRKRFSFPFDESQLPLNGIYILFEKGEHAHDGDRITRIGAHTGTNQLRFRLFQHFVIENKDRSIFRKNIGRAILNRNNDSFLEKWELDLTSWEAKQNFSASIDFNKQKDVELQVSRHIQENFSFVVFHVDDMVERLYIEKRLIATISNCTECKPSENWFGKFSTKGKIRISGLWQEQHLWKKPFSEGEMSEIEALIKNH
ncbi:MAG: hypothetical protein IH597_06320 [Bacteroidales bacterium]|nr:hypothetical protein [Bacteroidales bacterium]